MSIVRYVECERDDGAARAVHASVMAILGWHGAAAFPLRVGQVDCGDGNVCRLWAERGHAVFGVDESHALITMARRHSRDCGLEVRLDVASTTALPWTDHSLDVCLCGRAPEPGFWREIGLDEMVRVLKPGGVLHFGCADPAVGLSLRTRGMLVLDRFDLAGRAAGSPLARTRWALMGAVARMGFVRKMQRTGGTLVAIKPEH